jgi:hypothetical protein
MKIGIFQSRNFKTEIADRTIEIDGFKRYFVFIEGAQITSKDESPKRLNLSISLDGSLNLSLEKTELIEKDYRNILAQKLPSGYEFYFETEADKIIKGVRGRYCYFRNPNTKDFVAIATGVSGREYTIHLGRIDDPKSKLGTVLQSLPDRPFVKAELVHILPQSIVENRQPIKATIDILEKEGFVQKVRKEGARQQYVKTNKPIPHVKETLMKNEDES